MLLSLSLIVFNINVEVACVAAVVIIPNGEEEDDDNMCSFVTVTLVLNTNILIKHTDIMSILGDSGN